MNREHDYWYDGDRYVAQINGYWLGADNIKLGEFESYDEALDMIAQWWAAHGVEIEDPRKYTARGTFHVGHKGSPAGDLCRGMIWVKRESEDFPAMVI